jgi:LPXTG-motif cell wall-anchored protein
MSKKIISWLMIIGGLLLSIVSLIADLIKIGSYPGINSAQIIGALVGFLIFLLGLFFWLRKKEKQD